jgi:hypothetical protein
MQISKTTSCANEKSRLTLKRFTATARTMDVLQSVHHDDDDDGGKYLHGLM